MVERLSKTSAPGRLLYSVDEAAELLGIGRTFMFHLVATGEIDSFKIGKRRKIPRDALDSYIQRLRSEQLAGAAAQKTSDVYALGVILYRLLTGRLPYQGLEDKLAKVQSHEDPPLPSQNIRADLQTTPETTAQLKRRMMGDLDQIVLKSMRFNPKERYQTAAELTDDLQRFLDGLSVTARKQGVFSRSGRLLKRKWVAVAVIAAFLVLGGVSVWQWLRSHNEAADAAAREAEMHRLLDSLEARAAQDPSSAKAAERIEDLRQLREAFDKKFAPVLATTAATSAETKSIFAQAARYLDRLSPQAKAAPELGIELAAVYQQTGVLQEKSVRSNPAGSGAVQSYTKSATLLNQVAAVKPDDPRIGARLAFLNKRITGLGGTAVAPEPIPAAVQVETPPSADPPQQASAQTVAERPPPPPPAQSAEPTAGVSRQEMEAAQEQLVNVEAKVKIAEQTLEPYQRDLANSGQSVNADLLSAASRMKTQLEVARRHLANGDLAAAKESLGAADGLASKVLRALGR